MKFQPFKFWLILFAAFGFACDSGNTATTAVNTNAVTVATATPAQVPANTVIVDDVVPSDLDVPYVPTHESIVDEMLTMAEVKATDVLYDLGSGDGRIPITAAKRFGTRGVGVDLNPVRIREANDNAKAAGVTDKVRFIQGDLFEQDFSEATVVSLYLLSTLNMRLRPAILNMKPGTRIVTQSFTMSDWKPDHFEIVSHNEGGFSDTRNVYFYVVPAKVDGKWTMTQGERTFAFDIEQKFQFFTGTATVNGKPAQLHGRLNGPKIEFTLDLDGEWVKYEGTVNGSIIEGTGTLRWNAKKT